MKHIKKRYKHEKPATKALIDRLNATQEKVENLNPKKPKPKAKNKILMYHEGAFGKKIIEGFHHSKDGFDYYVPEPDPVLIYFHNAYMNHLEIPKLEKMVYEVLKQKTIPESSSIQIYAHFGACMSFVSSLFFSIEAFINTRVPNGYKFTDGTSEKAKTYNKDEILEHLNFKTKWTKMLRDIEKKDFFKDHPNEWQHLQNLKDFRDIIAHTKPQPAGQAAYAYLFKRIFKFDYIKTLDAAQTYINYYKPRYIVECDCGKDF